MRPFNLLDATPQQVLSFARQQTHVLNARVYSIIYPEMDYASLVPVNTALPEWADGIDTMIMDKVGEAKFVSGSAKDVPLADTNMDMVSLKFAMYALGYQYNLEELGKAAFVNLPLVNRRAEAARFGSEQFAWQIATLGKSDKGWKGLLNHGSITPTSLPADGTGGVTHWVGNDGVGLKTPAQIVRDVNLMLIGNPDSPVRMVKDTLLLPNRAYDHIVNTPYGVTSPNLSIMQYIRQNNEYTNRTGQPLTIRSMWELRNAATAVTVGGGRMVAYRNSPDVLEMHVPMPFRFLPVWQDGPMNFVVPGISRVGPVDIMRADGVSYGDAVTPVPA